MTLGPGSYKTADEIEMEQRAREEKRHKPAQNSGFNSSDTRERSDYIATQVKKSPFLGKAGQYQMQSSVIKKSFNTSLMPEK